MYKKISIALCIVISLFFIVPLVYLWWTMEPGKQAHEIKGPYAAIYLRNLTTANHSILLNDIPNSDFMLERSLWEMESLSHSSLFSTNNVNAGQYRKSFVLECHANAPVKWEYKGQGGLVSEMRHHDKREITKFEDNSTYWFTTSIEFLSISEQISGKYVCSVVDAPEKSLYFHIYVKGFNTFITKEELREEVEPDQEIIVPCPISDPEQSQSIILRELLQPLSTDVFSNVDLKVIRSFDPQLGFKLLPNNWGTFVCVHEQSVETSGIVKIFKPRRLVVKGDYLTKSFTTVPIPKNDTSLRPLCEAKENVTLNFINTKPFRRRQVHHYNKSDPDFPFSSRIIMRNEFFTDYTTVECISVKDERVLRVWVYVRQESSDKTSFKFDAARKGYECCTDSGIKVIPRLTQASCYSQTECEMKRSCVKLEKKCPDPQILSQPIYEGNPGCAVAKVEKNPSGILECSFGNTTKTYLYFYNEKLDFHNFTSSDFRKKKVPLKQLVQVKQRYASAQDTATFECSGPKFFFTNGFQWGLRRVHQDKTEHIEYIVNQSEIDQHSIAEVKESLTLPISKVQFKTVICYAPLMFSYEWINATVKYKRVLSTTPTLFDDR